MGLSEYDKKVLEQLERDLSGLSSNSNTPSNTATKLIAGALVALVGMSLVVFAAIAQIVAFGVAGFLISLVGVLVASASNTSKAHSTPKKSPKSGKSGTFFEDRWERRRDQSQ